MDVLEAARARIRGRRGRVVFPEGGDERIVAAARRLADDGLAEPILLGPPATDERLERYASLYREGRPDA